MLDVLVSILTGGATGLIGTLVTGVTGYVQARQKHAQEMELRRLDMELVRVEAEVAERVAAREAESAESAAAWAALEASHKEAGRRWSRGDSGWIVFVDVVRGLTRPGLTLAFVAFVGAIYFTLGTSDTDASGLRPRIVETVLYLATTCVLWWFGARQVAKGGGRAR